VKYAYNTNGLAHHRLADALSLLADTGYAGVALTLDVQHLDPFAADALAGAERVRARCDALGLGVVVETGARYLLDPRAKHEPTLVTADADGRARRLAYLRLACDLAGVLGAEAVSFWAGVPKTGADRDAAWGWLVDGVRALLYSQYAPAMTQCPVSRAREMPGASAARAAQPSQSSTSIPGSGSTASA